MTKGFKILRPFTGTGSIFFPIGKPPVGTCEFATKSCLEFCYAALPDWPDFDEEIRVSKEEKKEIYKIFMEAPVWWLVEEIERELDGLQTDILHWFGSGDCQSGAVGKVIELIGALDQYSISQMGFTRNVDLWKARPDVFALTIESVDAIDGRDGMFSVSDYIHGTSRLYFNNMPTRGGLCGPELCLDRKEVALSHFINCQICKRLGTGCFYR